MDNKYRRSPRRHTRVKDKKRFGGFRLRDLFTNKYNFSNPGFSMMPVVMSLLAVVMVASSLAGLSAWTRSTKPKAYMTTPPPFQAGTVDPDPEASNEDVGQMLDLSMGASTLSFDFNSINQPMIYGDTLLFSAGSGSPDQPVLKSLYTYQISSNELKKISDTKIEYGEIYEPQISEKWIIWLDTDQGNTHLGYFMDRTGAMEPFSASYNYVKPKFRLNGNMLAWMAQTAEKNDSLFIMNLNTGEDLMLYQFINAPEYGMSAPCVDGSKVVWAGPDRLQSDAQRTQEPQSVIMTFDFNNPYADTEDDENEEASFLVEEYRPGMYVHEPILRGNKLAWIDKNKSPDSNLYTCVDNGAPMFVAEGVTSYALGDGFLVYACKETIWVYFYGSGRHARLTTAGEKGILPIVSERTIVWYDRTSGGSKDVLKIRTILEEEYPDGSGTDPLPVATPAPAATDSNAPPEGFDPNAEPSPEPEATENSDPNAT